MKELGAVSLLVLVGLSTCYWLLWRLHKRTFLALIALGWLANAPYIALEAWPPQTMTKEAAETVVCLLSLASTAFFFVAFRSVRDDAACRRPSSLGWLFVIGLAVGLGCQAASWWMPAASPWRFTVLTGPGAIITSAVLLSLGLRLISVAVNTTLPFRNVPPTLYELTSNESLEASTQPQDLGPMRKANRQRVTGKLLLGTTFIGYGFIQLLYPLKGIVLGEFGFTLIFYFALLLKLTNCGGAGLLISGHSLQLVAWLRQRSVAEELGYLTASIEHDIRNPLTNLRKKVATTKRQHQHDKELTNALEFIDHQAERIRAAVGVIPAFRATEQFVRDRFLVWNLVDIARTAASVVKKAWAPVECRIPVTTTRAVIRVLGVRERLVQVCVNIINNGIEACREKDAAVVPSVEIRCSEDSAAHLAQVAFRDSGIGLSDMVRRNLTRPGYSTKRKLRENVGIGLFTASRFVEHHGGNIFFDSDGQSYTEVTVELPLFRAGEGAGT